MEEDVKKKSKFVKNFEKMLKNGGNLNKITVTLRVESFAGRKFRDFASFLVARESLYSWNRSEKGIRESLSPRNHTFKGLHEISPENY